MWLLLTYPSVISDSYYPSPFSLYFFLHFHILEHLEIKADALESSLLKCTREASPACPSVLSPVLWGAPTQEVTPTSLALAGLPHLLHLCRSPLHSLPTAICSNSLPNRITLLYEMHLLCAVPSIGLGRLFLCPFPTVDSESSPGSGLLKAINTCSVE